MRIILPPQQTTTGKLITALTEFPPETKIVVQITKTGK